MTALISLELPVLKRLALSAAILGGTTAGVLALAPAAFAAPAPLCVASCTVSFSPGAQTTWDVPANASDVEVTVAAGAGGSSVYFPGTEGGGTGGKATVDLGTAFDGQTLQLLVGDQGVPAAQGGVASGGQGSYLAVPGRFLVIADGGGGEGTTNDLEPLDGGAGGYSTASPDGASGAEFLSSSTAGTGAIGATPGHGSTAPGLAEVGGTGGTASVDPAGSITAAFGGQAAVYVDFPTAQGGGGYAGGGGGGALSTSPAVAGAGGGGSGYLDPALTASSTAGNTGAGFITITYSLQPTISPSATSVAAGSDETVTVGALPAATPFTIGFGSVGTTVASGTTDADGNATVAFTVPTGTAAGSYTLQLIVGGTVVATSGPITVTALISAAEKPTLASTGANVPWWMPAGGIAIVVIGAALLVIARLRKARAARDSDG